MSTFDLDEKLAADAPVGRDAALGFAGLSTARVVSMTLQLVMFAALAGHLGAAGIGLFGFGLAAAQLFDVVANLGFKQVVTRDVSQEPADEQWLIPNYLYLRGLLGLLAFGGLIGFITLAGYDPAQREVALIAGTLLLLTTPQATQPMLEVRLKMAPIGFADVVESSLMLGGTLVLINQDAGVTAFLWLYVATNLINSVIIAWAALSQRRGLDWTPRPDRWRDVTKAAIVLGIASVFISIYYQIDIALLARFKPESDVGNYTAAFQALAAVNVIPAVLMTVLAPVLARSIKGPLEILQRRYSLAVHLVSLIAVPVAVGGALTAWRLLPLIPQFESFGQGGVALSILSVAAGLIFVGTIVQATLIAGHLQRKLLKVAILGAVANFGLNVIAIPRFSLYGAAAATVATELAVVISSHRIAHDHLDLRWPVRRSVRLSVPAAAMVVVAALTYGLPVLVQVAMVAIAYLVSIAATGAFRITDLNSLRAVGEGVTDIVIDGQEPGGGRTVAPTYRSVRNALGGFRTAHLHSTRPVPWSVLAAARVAGVHHLEIHRTTPLARRERWRLEFFSDEIHVAEPPPAADVLFVNEGALGSGILGHLAALASLHAGLDAAGVRHDIEVIGGPERLGERFWSSAVPILGSFDLDLQPSRWHAVMARRTRRLVRRHPEPKQLVVVAHTIAIGLLPTLRRVPSYVFIDATIRQWAGLGLWRKVRPWTFASLWWSLRQERKVFRSATIVAYSEWAAEGVRAEVPEADVTVLSPGIDTDRFHPLDVPRAPDEPLRILFVGGRFAEKGGFDLLAATEGMRPERVVIDVVTAADIGVHAGVRVHRLDATSPALVELYQRADVLCLPTRADGSPFVVLEAMATGTPVISTPIGAIPSLVGPAGTIVDVGDVSGLRTAIQALAADDDLRRQLSRAARLRAIERFSAIRQGARLAELLASDR